MADCQFGKLTLFSNGSTIGNKNFVYTAFHERLESTDPPATARVAAYLQARNRARPVYHTEEDLLLELRAKYLAVGSSMCSDSDLYIFDTKKLV
jgi:hypothetical protein